LLFREKVKKYKVTKGIKNICMSFADNEANPGYQKGKWGGVY